MAHNLVIDQGNSCAKVSVFHHQTMVGTWRYDSLTESALESVIREFGVEAAIYCSVVRHGEDVMVALRRMTARVYELTSMLPLPIAVGYKTPSTLGRDRIAAAAGAAALYPGRKALVIDAGTALTYDVVDADATFVGGNIAPGLWMRAEALHRMTSRLPEVDVEHDAEVETWGTSTEGAIRAGVVNGVVAECLYYRSLLPADAVTVLTGGDSEIIAKHMARCGAGDGLTVDPDLVSKGLNSILLYNENR